MLLLNSKILITIVEKSKKLSKYRKLLEKGIIIIFLKAPKKHIELLNLKKWKIKKLTAGFKK